MIDPNFLRYAVACKQKRIQTALPEELPKLIAECNELLALLVEGDPRQRELQIKNQEWLSRPIAA